MEASKSKHHHYTGGEGVYDHSRRKYKPVAPKRVESVEIDPSVKEIGNGAFEGCSCLLYTSPSPRDPKTS
eukprot:5501341-Ditylum_brightwellii.AAC.1